jgi:hypothetical protein
MTRLRNLPNLVTALELLAAATGRRVRHDVAEQSIPAPHDSTAVLAESACLALNGSPVRHFVSTDGEQIDTEQDALQVVIDDKSSVASRIIRELGEEGEALEQIIDDAMEGELSEIIFEPGE